MQYLRFGVLFIALSISSCYPSSGTLSPKAIRPLGERPRVFVVNYPLRYFAERIGGDYIEVHFPVPADIDPAFWRPDSQVIRGFQEADLILLNGAGYAKWLQMVSLPTSRMVNTTEAVRKKYILVKDGVTHQHGPEGKHTHAGTAFTTWLDPTIAIAQARSVKDALAKLSPEHASVFEANFAELEKDLAALDAEFEAVFAGVGQQPLLASHPVYQYLAQRYGLNLQSVHWEPDEFPAEKDWQELQQLVKKHPARIMLWEGQPLAKTDDKLKAMGIASVVFDPVGNQPEEGNFLDIMHANAQRVRRALKK